MRKVKLIALSMSFSCGVAFAVNKGSPHWAYEGANSAEHWGDLDKHFSECKLGKEQSPIDIPTQSVTKENLDPIKPAYRASSGHLVNNGSTVRVDLTDGGTVEVPTGKYEILQFHFHTPSEEKFDGHNYPMVVHMVHKGEKGKLVVIASLVSSGKENAALKDVFSALPAHKGSRHLKADFDASRILPATLSYYTFEGSLTTPPCSEGVEWYVLKTPIEMSEAQINAFRKVYKMNARPTQPLNGRKIVEVD